MNCSEKKKKKKKMFYVFKINKGSMVWRPMFLHIFYGEVVKRKKKKKKKKKKKNKQKEKK